MKFTSTLVDKFAQDLLFHLTEEENKNVLDEFEVIEENMEKITQMDGIEEYEPMTHALEYESISLREDEVGEELEVEEVLQNAKDKTLEEIVVPKVVE